MAKKIEDRLSKLENTRDALLQKFTKIEEVFEAAGLDRLSKKVEDIESK